MLSGKQIEDLQSLLKQGQSTLREALKRAAGMHRAAGLIHYAKKLEQLSEIFEEENEQELRDWWVMTILRRDLMNSVL